MASFDFPESVLLAEIYSQALERAGYDVERKLNLGPRELAMPALERGLIEFVPEYLGTALEFLNGGAGEATSNVKRTHRKLARRLAERGITVLAPAPAQDKNGIAVTKATAAKYRLRSVSDLLPFAGDLVFGGPPECPHRPLCLPGLKDTYRLEFKEFVPLDASGPYTSAYLAQGQVDVALMFTTDEELAARQFVLLEDDLRLQPAENVTPVVSQEIVDRYGDDLVRTIDSVSRRLTTAAVTRLNRQVSLGRPPRQVAADWLNNRLS